MSLWARASRCFLRTAGATPHFLCFSRMCRFLLDAADFFELNPVREAEQCGQRQLCTIRGHPTMHPSCLIPNEALALEHGALYCIGRSPPDTRKQRLTSAYCDAHTRTHTRSLTHTHHTRTHTRNILHCNPLHLLHCSRDAALYCTILNCFWEASAHNTAFTVAGARYCTIL